MVSVGPLDGFVPSGHRLEHELSILTTRSFLVVFECVIERVAILSGDTLGELVATEFSSLCHKIAHEKSVFWLVRHNDLLFSPTIAGFPSADYMKTERELISANGGACFRLGLTSTF